MSFFENFRLSRIEHGVEDSGVSNFQILFLRTNTSLKWFCSLLSEKNVRTAVNSDGSVTSFDQNIITQSGGIIHWRFSVFAAFI